MRFELPLPPNRINQRKHWWIANKEKKDFWERCTLAKHMGLCPEPPEAALARVRVRATLYVWALMDLDNAMARLKAAMDWLVGWGYIEDDSPKHVEWAGLPEQVVDRKNQRLVIELEPLEAVTREEEKESPRNEAP